MSNQERTKTKGTDVFLSLELDLLETVTGTTKEFNFEKKGNCPTCKGSRCKEGTKPTRCVACGGKGYVNYR